MLSLAAEELTHIGPVPITNAVLNTLLVDIILIALAYFVYKNAKLIPGAFQSVVEMVMEGFYNLITSVSKNNAKKIFPYVMTFFLFILIANWTGLLPIISALEVPVAGHGGEVHHAHLFRSASTD